MKPILITLLTTLSFEYFVSKHYDVFNLIPNGLAIDINSINQTSK